MKDMINQEKEVVILIHGFNNDESDMFPLKQHLQSVGYEAVTMNLPLRFSEIEDCIAQFEEQFYQQLSDFRYYDKIHLVGFSMGGLVVRSFLARNIVPNLGRCVLIATPNQGTKLADMSEKWIKPMGQIFKPIKSLRTNNLDIGDPMNTPKPEIGVIAGNTNKHLLGIFLTKENDGMVEVESVKYQGMTDFVIKPFGHKEIHHQLEIANLVDLFLRTGKFSA